MEAPSELGFAHLSGVQLVPGGAGLLGGSDVHTAQGLARTEALEFRWSPGVGHVGCSEEVPCALPLSVAWPSDLLLPKRV